MHFVTCMLLGIKAGMFVKDAKARCPHLVIVHYDFGAYEKVSVQPSYFNSIIFAKA